LISRLNLDLVINPIQSSLFKRPAERPLNGVLDTLKLRQAIDFQPDSWQDQVNKFLGVF
jgi:dTDP-4-dehydrorhamnose reductase